MKELSNSDTKKKHQTVRKMMEQYFPFILKKVYFINAPKFMRIMLGMVSWTFSKKKKDRLCMLGSDYLSVLDKEFGLQNLPKCIGGTNPIPLTEFQNFWDQEIQNSFVEKRLSRK